MNKNRLRELQYGFAAHIRDPDRTPAPGDVEDRRMKIYRELFFNNVSGFLAGTFPVLNRILGEQRWEALVRDFYRDHRCDTPLFLEIPQEFLSYLAEERAANDTDPRFLHELAHYEWVELALGVEETTLEDADCDPDGDLLAGKPVLSPLAWPLAYRYPVHRLSPDYQPAAAPAEPSFYVVYRGTDDSVSFMQINAVTMRLVERLRQHPGLSGRQQLEALADELPQIEREQVLTGGQEALLNLRSHEVLLGTRRTKKEPQ